MPRRLGDDPLTRTRKGTTRTSRAVTPSPSAVAVDSAAPLSVSTNDVFFQRRAQESDQVASSTQQRVAEAPQAEEISEISQITAFRELATIPSVQSDKPAAIEETSRVQDPPQSPAVPLVSEAALSKSVVSTVSEEAQPAEQAAPAESIPKEEGPSFPSVESQTPTRADDQPQPEKKGGLLKRFFNRFGK